MNLWGQVPSWQPQFNLPLAWRLGQGELANFIESLLGLDGIRTRQVLDWGCYLAFSPAEGSMAHGQEELGGSRSWVQGVVDRPFRLLKSRTRLSLQWSHRSLHPLCGRDGGVSRKSQPGEGSGEAGSWPLDWH